jgi:hypothetical protein
MPSNQSQSQFYAKTLRTLIRYAIAMAIFGVLIGIAYQESAQKLTYADAPAGLRLAAVMPLALVHGHVFTLGVLLPLALAGALVLGLRAGGGSVGPRALAWLRWVFLPFITATLALQLFKGYFVLLAVRHGQPDLAAVDASFMAGSHTLRYALYAVVHSGMGISLCVFLVALWRSLGVKARG